jgi:hypothetical protein
MSLHHHKTLLESGEGTQTKLSNNFEVPDFDLTKTTQHLHSPTTKQKHRKKTTANALANQFPHFPLLTQ